MKQNTFFNPKGDYTLDKHAFLLMPYVRFLFFVTASQLVSVITDDLRAENVTKTVNRPKLEYIHLSVAPLYRCFFF